MHETQVSHKHTHTLQQIFQHPPSHNLEWHNVVALVKDSGTVHEGDNGSLTFTLNGITGVFRPTHDKKDVSDVQQVLDLRHFLESAGFQKDGVIHLPTRTSDAGSTAEKERHSHDHGNTNADQNRHAEQQIKTQEHEQNERSGFQEGSAQAHQQGNRQR